MSKEKREKYGSCITSREYIQTGRPQNAAEHQTDESKEISRLLEINKTNTEKAIKNFRQWKAKRKGPEYKIIFE